MRGHVEDFFQVEEYRSSKFFVLNVVEAISDMLGKNLERQFNKEIGRYDVNSCLGLLRLSIMMIFAALGIWPNLRENWKMVKIICLILSGLFDTIPWKFHHFQGQTSCCFSSDVIEFIFGNGQLD